MTISNYLARVDERGALTISKEAQEALNLRQGEEVRISIDRTPSTSIAPNEKMLSILQDMGAPQAQAVYGCLRYRLPTA